MTDSPAAPSPFGRVTVLGLGVLGAQIALQTAAHGVEVTGYDIDDAALQVGRGRLDSFARAAAHDVQDPDAYRAAPARIRLTSDREKGRRTDYRRRCHRLICA